MRILVANHWLAKLGGSETFTYTLIGELVRQGHRVDLHTNIEGIVSDKIQKDFRVVNVIDGKYDLVLANHYTTVEKLYARGFVIQTCHGIFPRLEQPSPRAHYHVSISDEVQFYLNKLGFPSDVILNGIDQRRFRLEKEINKVPKVLLSMVQSEEANAVVKRACNLAGVKYTVAKKYKVPIWEMEEMINGADIVVSLGRGAYEAMSCGRTVIVYDNRKYFDSCGDGYLTLPDLHESIRNNCSGRRFKKKFTAESLAAEILRHQRVDADSLHGYAKENLNMELQVQKYLKIYESRC